MPIVVLITGGSSGIGKAIGNYLMELSISNSEKEYIVYGTSRNPAVMIANSRFHLVAMDVTNSESISKAILDIIEIEGRIDVLVNNAGIGITGPIEETPNEEIIRAFGTNFIGPINVMKAVLPQMRKQGGGKIINITSIAGYMGLPYRGIYSASKAALAVATEAFRMETKQFGIQMCNVAPGDFATNIIAGRYHAPVLENSPYKDVYGKTLAMMNEHVDAGEDPIKMAKVVHAIIENDNPKINYKVGASVQKFSIVLKRILPDRVYERMLLNHYKIK